jgi:nickel/cobalt transporter (NicO) family protein
LAPGRTGVVHPSSDRARTLCVVGRRLFLAFLLGAIGAGLPAPVLAHPLGNFTINHYAGITVGRDQVLLDVVIDMAEIPTFQERLKIDTDGDGDVSDEEAAAAAPVECAAEGSALRLAVGGAPIAVGSASRAAISFPPGLGGLSTMRIECGYAAVLPAALGGRTTITFSDTSFTDRIGWREVVVSGDGVTIEADGLPATSPSKRLTSYPADMISQPLDMRSVTIVATPQAAPIGTAVPAQAGPAAPAAAEPAAAGIAVVGAVPGGVGGELPAIFQSVDLSPIVLLLSILTALGLGAGHAVTPGHGKTLMAAYLVGTRGTALHAVGLGLAVTVSHTLGILVLAALVVGAQGLLPPDVVVRGAPVVAAVTIVAIGGWMLLAEFRRRLAARSTATVHSRHNHDHDHGVESYDHDHGHGHDVEPHEHRHGGLSHSHLPPAGSTISWRGLIALGLAGGLIPSTSALFILLGSIVAGRPAFGFVLVVVFGFGMALVMTGVGLAMVFARTRLDRLPSGSGFGRLARHAPLVAAVVVLAFGLYLTAQAIGGRPVL